MHRFSGLLLLLFVCLCTAGAQTGEDPAIAAAKADLDKLHSMVEMGVAPRAQLAKAEDALADAQDSAFLRKTAYGQELTLEQADQMIAAADRRLDRRQRSVDDAKKLVDAGVANPQTLDPLREDLERAHKERDLAEGRAKFTAELNEMAMAEQAAATKAVDALAAEEKYDGDGVMAYSTYAKVEVAFEEHFGKKMPVSAVGETAVHRAMGFDHRGRVDVALHPDDPQGVWLLHYLQGNHIPYFAFRSAVPGKATGAHIHIGPGSTRLVAGG